MTCPTDVLTAKTNMPPAAANASSAARTAVTTYPTGRWPRAWRAADGKLTGSPYRDNLGRVWDAVGRVVNGYRASVRLEWGDSGVDRDDPPGETVGDVVTDDVARDGSDRGAVIEREPVAGQIAQFVGDICRVMSRDRVRELIEVDHEADGGDTARCTGNEHQGRRCERLPRFLPCRVEELCRARWEFDRRDVEPGQ